MLARNFISGRIRGELEKHVTLYNRERSEGDVKQDEEERKK